MASRIVSLLKRPKRLTIVIPLVYFLVILFTVLLSAIFFQRTAWHSAQTQINEAALQTVASLETNVHLLVNNVNDYSKMILSDANLQNLLRGGNLYADLDMQARVGRDMHNIMQTFPSIDGIYIFDLTGHGFSVGARSTPAFLEARVEDAPWYGEVVEQQGNFLLRLNGGGVFAREPGENFVSFIRLIRDLDDTSPLGILVIHIPERAFAELFVNMAHHNDQQFAILDEQHRLITTNAGAEDSRAAALAHLLEKGGMRESVVQHGSSGTLPATIESRKYTVSWQTDDSLGWTFLNVAPKPFFSYENTPLVLLTFVLLVVNGIVFFVSSFIISRNVLSPIKQLLKAMESTRRDRLVKLESIPNYVEFGQLFIGYNRMIEQINALLKRIIEEQRTIRKAELNTLQAQIKPHFLYNTLDSITSLAMSGLNDQVCEMLEALGNYYRLSVSKGREVITVGEEIAMVRNYLRIQKVRYPDLFEVDYDVDEDSLSVPILKLVLQPLVENALYHGLRTMGSMGTITIGAQRRDGQLQLTIGDNGVGMSAEQVQRILEMEKSGETSSFGLRGTMERLRIYYGGNNAFHIDSEPGKGTTITLLIPTGEEDTWTS